MEVNTLINRLLTAAIDWLQENYSYYISFMSDGGKTQLDGDNMYKHTKRWLYRKWLLPVNKRFPLQ